MCGISEVGVGGWRVCRQVAPGARGGWPRRPGHDSRQVGPGKDAPLCSRGLPTLGSAWPLPHTRRNCVARPPGRPSYPGGPRDLSYRCCRGESRAPDATEACVSQIRVTGVVSQKCPSAAGESTPRYRQGKSVQRVPRPWISICVGAFMSLWAWFRAR